MSDRSQFASDMAAGVPFQGHPFRPTQPATPTMPPPSLEDARESMKFWRYRAYEAHIRLRYGVFYGWPEARLQQEADALYNACVCAATCYRHLPLKVVCAWCDTMLSNGREPISHGICPTCEQRVEEQERAKFEPQFDRDDIGGVE